jgi:excisionase family DNA binding protein
METASKFLDLKAAAAYTGQAVSVRTLRRWIATGRLAAYKPGGKVLIRRRDLDNLVTGAKVGADLDELVSRLISEVEEARQ